MIKQFNDYNETITTEPATVQSYKPTLLVHCLYTDVMLLLKGHSNNTWHSKGGRGLPKFHTKFLTFLKDRL